MDREQFIKNLESHQRRHDEKCANLQVEISNPQVEVSINRLLKKDRNAKIYLQNHSAGVKV